MKLSLSEIIEKQTEIPYNKVILAFQLSDILDMTTFRVGNVNEKNCEGNFEAIINPPTFWSDIVTSSVNGNVQPAEGLTNIRLKISPSWIIIGICVIWSILMILMIATFKHETISQSLRFVGLSLVWISIPFLVGRLKVYWDKKRLERWINKTIETIPSYDKLRIVNSGAKQHKVRKQIFYSLRNNSKAATPKQIPANKNVPDKLI